MDKLKVKQVLMENKPIILDWIREELKAQSIKDWKTVPELAKMFGKHTLTINRWVEKLDIKPRFVNPGGQPMYDPFDFNTLKN